MAAGRPSKYNASYLKKAQDYVENYQALGDVVPSIVGLACELGVSKNTLYAWGRDNVQFLNTLEAIESTQHRKLLSGGLNSSFQPTIAKLMLANHGYHDKQDTQLSGGVEVKTIERRIVKPDN